MRRPLIAANWKMHKTVAEATTFMGEFRAAGGDRVGTEVVICPPFTALAAVAAGAAGTAIAVGAQNLHHEEQGAFTGEIAAGMLADAGCRYVIVGHSERRRLFAETDTTVQEKVAAALRWGVRPILCLGETLAQREAGGTELVIGRQLEAALQGLPVAAGGDLVVAYEPIWAIGTGRAASSADAQRAGAFLRRSLGTLIGAAAGQAVRILYGGSVSAANIGSFVAEADIDGALVGGASLDPAGFAGLVLNADRGRPFA